MKSKISVQQRPQNQLSFIQTISFCVEVQNITELKQWLSQRTKAVLLFTTIQQEASILRGYFSQIGNKIIFFLKQT